MTPSLCYIIFCMSSWCYVDFLSEFLVSQVISCGGPVAFVWRQMRFSGEAQVTKYISQNLFPVHTNQRFDAEQKHFRQVAESSSAISERKLARLPSPMWNNKITGPQCICFSTMTKCKKFLVNRLKPINDPNDYGCSLEYNVFTELYKAIILPENRK